MYAEEYLPDDAVFDTDDVEVSVDDSMSMDTEEIERKKITELYRRTDPDYYSYKKYEKDLDGNTHFQRVRLYSSPPIGKIRNAPTGIREEHRVGTAHEDLYFRVKDVSLFTKTDTNKEPRKLFYRNPEEFERHLDITLPMSIKNAWHEKHQRALLKLKD
jgi:hypothetical protein